MKIAFFGHADFIPTPEIEKRLYDILKEETKGETVEFWFGGYGDFDSFAYAVVNKYFKGEKIAKIFITPYITEGYQKNQIEYIKDRYDLIIYPELESTPYRYAISKRNSWMAENCDIVICYVKYSYGGAYKAVKYASRKGKRIINISKESAS